MRNQMLCFHMEVKNRETQSRVLSSSALIRQIWWDPFLKAIKIICSVRQDVNLWSKNIKLDLSIIVSVSFSNNLLLKDWNYRTHSTDILSLDEDKFVDKKNYPWRKSSLRYSDPKHARDGGNEESSRTTSWWSLSAKVKRKSRDNTKRCFSVAGNARWDEFYEWFKRISRSGIKIQWEIVLRFQSTCNDSKFSFHAEPRQTLASWHMEYIGIKGKRFWKSIFYVWFTTRSSSRSSLLRTRISSSSNKNRRYSFRSCHDFPSEAMLWIKEVEMVDSMEELKSSRSVADKNFPNFEVLDARIASSLNKIIHNSHFKKKISLEEQKAQRDGRFLRGRQIAFMIYDYFRVTGAHDTVLDYADLFSVTLHDDNIQEFDTRWDEVLLSLIKIPPRNSNLYWNCTTWKFITRHRCPIIKNWRQWWKEKRSETSITKFWRQTRENWNRSSGKNRNGMNGVEGGKGTWNQWKEKGQCSKGDQCTFRHDTQDPAQKPEDTAATFSEPSMSRGRSVSRKRSIQGKSNHGAILRQPWRYYLKGTCTRSLCEYWHPPGCVKSTKLKRVAKPGARDKYLFPRHQVDEQPNKKPKKGYHSHKGRESDDNNAVAIVKIVPQLGCVSQDSEALVSQRGKHPRRETRCKESWGRFEEYDSHSLRFFNQVSGNRKDHRLENCKSKILISEVPTLWNLRTGPMEEPERQHRCARSKAWKLAKNIYKLKEKDNSNILLTLGGMGTSGCVNKRAREKREFLVESGACEHMVSKRDQTREEATEKSNNCS